MTSNDMRDRPVALWLLGVAALVFLMVIVGGVTRLTGSGLSMVEWKPVTGFIPPLNEADWQTLFDQYRQYPEFQQVNRDMDLAGFKGIFWLEFIHRLLGRLIGIAFLVPFLFFLFTHRLSTGMAPRLLLMFVLGGLQGLLGWYMVKSGLVDDPRVSPYRLTAHLMLAVAIYTLILWTALGLMWPAAKGSAPGVTARSARIGTGLTLLVALVMASGGFVAGLDAGLIYNTFPLMGDDLVAPGVYANGPWWHALFEDAVTVQFNHRLLAVTTLVLILLFWWRTPGSALSRPGRRWLNLVPAAALLQVTLGITTLLMRVPVALGAAHQAGALLLLTCLLVLTFHLHRDTP